MIPSILWTNNHDELGLLKNSAQIEQQNLHALKNEKLPGPRGDPVLATIWPKRAPPANESFVTAQ